MAQTKKQQIREAILAAAYELFAKHGYSDTNITDIARTAGVAPANVYVYFKSKLDILFCIYEPWLSRQFDELERSLKRVKEPRKRLSKILATIWHQIPSADNGFANNLMQALSTTTTREGYRPTLRLAIEERLAGLFLSCLPNLGSATSREMANIALMAFDGYVLNFHLTGGATCPARRSGLFTNFLLCAETAASREAAKAKPTLRARARISGRLATGSQSEAAE
jgi:AcrR family transcriptional regulator